MSVLKQLEGSEFAVTKIGTGALGPAAVLWGAVSLALDAISSVAPSEATNLTNIAARSYYDRLDLGVVTT